MISVKNNVFKVITQFKQYLTSDGELTFESIAAPLETSSVGVLHDAEQVSEWSDSSCWVFLSSDFSICFNYKEKL